jgi:hypothetical protein
MARFKLFLIFCLTVFVLSVGPNLSAQVDDLESITPELLNKQPPLTQKDFDMFFKYMEFEKKNQNDPAGTIERAKKFIAENNLTAIRWVYVTEKIIIYDLQIKNPEALSGKPLPPYLAVSEEEKKLFLANADKLLKQVDNKSGNSILNQVTAEDLAKEGPLTQGDIDLFISFGELVYKNKNKDKLNITTNVLDNLSNKFVSDNGITLTRLFFINQKVPLILATLEDPSFRADEGAPANLMSHSEAEMDLVKKNMRQITVLTKKLGL